MKRDYRLLIVIMSIFCADQALKYIIVEIMDLRNQLAIDLIDPYLNFRMAWNRGINFGLGASDGFIMRYILIGFAAGVSTVLYIWGRRFHGWLAPILIGMIIGGALGNMIDRIRFGAVADFLNMSCCGINNPYAFNIADIAIFIGAIGLAFLSEKLPKYNKNDG